MMSHELLGAWQVTTDLDTEVAGTIMLLELVLALGFAVPLLLPVTAAAMLLHAIAFEVCVRHQGVTLIHEACPPFRYLLLSLGLGAALVLWMFAECGWAGRLLVFVGMPTAIVLGAAAPELLSYLVAIRSRTVDAPQLQVSLFDGSEEAAHNMIGSESSEVEGTRSQTEYFEFDPVLELELEGTLH